MSIAYQRWTPGRKFSADPPETRNSASSLALHLDSRWRPESGVKGRARFRFMVTLGDGADILGAAVVLSDSDGVWPELAWRVEHGAAQVLEQAQAVGGHGQAAPAAGGPVLLTAELGGTSAQVRATVS